MFKTRLLSGIVLVLVALLTICSGGTVLYMTVLCLSLIGAGELFRVMKVREDKWNLLEITGYAGVVIFYLSLLLHDPMYQMLALILDLVLLMAVYVFTYPKYNAIQLLLHLQYLVPGRADGEVIPRPGGRDAGNLLRRVDIHIVSIIIAENLNR